MHRDAPAHQLRLHSPCQVSWGEVPRPRIFRAGGGEVRDSAAAQEFWRTKWGVGGKNLSITHRQKVTMSIRSYQREAAVEKTTAKEVVEAVRAGLPDPFPFDPKWQQLTRGERALLLTFDLDVCVHWDGFSGYFSQCQEWKEWGVWPWQEVVDGFAAIGAARLSGIIAQALALCPDGQLPENYWSDESAEKQALSKGLQALGSQFYNADENTVELLARFVRASPDEFPGA